MKAIAGRALLAALILALARAPAEAHRLDIDPRRLPGGRVRIELFYSDGRPAEGASVVARGPDGKEVARGSSGAGGVFEFQAPEGLELTVEARHGGGHLAACRIPAGAADPSPASARERGPFPLGRLALGIAIIGLLAALLRWALRRSRAS
jgi:hypothetical protein